LGEIDPDTVEIRRAKSPEEKGGKNAMNVKKKVRVKKILDNIINEIFKDTLITSAEIPDGFELVIPLPGERKKKVFVTFGRQDSEEEEIFQIFTICCEASTSLYEFALRMNMELDYGALALKEMYGDDFFVIVDTQLVRTAQPVEIEKSVITLAEIGDDIERILTGKDLR